MHEKFQTSRPRFRRYAAIVPDTVKRLVYRVIPPDMQRYGTYRQQVLSVYAAVADFQVLNKQGGFLDNAELKQARDFYQRRLGCSRHTVERHFQRAIFVGLLRRVKTMGTQVWALLDYETHNRSAGEWEQVRHHANQRRAAAHAEVRARAEALEQARLEAIARAEREAEKRKLAERWAKMSREDRYLRLSAAPYYPPYKSALSASDLTGVSKTSSPKRAQKLRRPAEQSSQVRDYDAGLVQVRDILGFLKSPKAGSTALFDAVLPNAPVGTAHLERPPPPS